MTEHAAFMGKMIMLTKLWSICLKKRLVWTP